MIEFTGKQIQEARESQGLSRKDVAVSAGYSTSTVRDVEMDVRFGESRVAVLKALGMVQLPEHESNSQSLMCKLTGDQVSKAREAKGWSRPRLAKEAGVSLGAVEYIEFSTSNRPRGSENQTRIASALGLIDPDDQSQATIRTVDQNGTEPKRREATPLSTEIGFPALNLSNGVRVDRNGDNASTADPDITIPGALAVVAREEDLNLPKIMILQAVWASIGLTAEPDADTWRELYERISIYL